MQMESTSIKPFPQNAQYQKAFEKDGVDDDELKESTNKKGAKKNGSKKKKSKKRADVKNLSMEPANSDDSPVEYKAQLYSKMRQDFIDRAKADRGLSSKDAASEWNCSSQKRKMLAGLSVPELRRRRFIAKDCQHNPWAEAS